MKKYFLVAALVTAPVLASTSAHAITVNEGAQLTITIGGKYATTDEEALGVGSTLNLSDIVVLGIDSVNPNYS